ncbi:MAG: 50S ribosomal protein L11 methyltransferase [Myxococcota bacterium]
MLDHPEDFVGRRWLDVGAGSGLVALAAARGGARAGAIDLDPVAGVAARMNAALNRLAIDSQTGDAFQALPAVDGVFLADVTYEAELLRRVEMWCAQCREAGIEVYVADPGRGFVQRSSLAPRLEPRSVHWASADVGEAHRVETMVWRLQ